MAKRGGARRRVASRLFKPTAHSLTACNHGITKDFHRSTKCSKVLDKKDWKDARCSVCMECPHNAVLLLCSSHDKGCRAYMCGTSFKYSNCLDQYKKAYTKIVSSTHRAPAPGVSADNPIDIEDDLNMMDESNGEITELACPLCRGQVKGWTVVEPARDYLNSKRRSCMQDDCSFLGTYKDLRKHMKAEHPSARPREVDPELEQKWRSLQRENERDDVLSTIRSTMPGAMVFGDYVIEGNQNHRHAFHEEQGDFDSTQDIDFDLMNFFILFRAFGHSGDELRRRLRNPRQSNEGEVGIRHTSPVTGLSNHDQASGDEEDDANAHDGGMSLVSRLQRHNREILGRSARRRRRRDANNEEQDM
ncbi:hypothetical protein ACFE04_023819 [Oxalis oulophora]